MNKPEMKRFRQQYPQFGTDPISIESLVSEDFFELEREKLFTDPGTLPPPSWNFGILFEASMNGLVLLGV